MENFEKLRQMLENNTLRIRGRLKTCSQLRSCIDPEIEKEKNLLS